MVNIMATRRAKSINDIAAQRLRIQALVREAQNRTGSAAARRSFELSRRARIANAAASRYANNIASTKSYKKDGGMDFLQQSRATSRKYRNYDVEGKASAVG